METTGETIRAVAALYDQGAFADAAQAAASLGDPREWPGTIGRVLAGRLAFRLGAPRLAQALHLTAWKRDRQDPWAAYYAAGLVYVRRRSWHALRWLREHAPPHSVGEPRALWLGLGARCLADLRDFERAFAQFEEALAVAPSSSYLRVEQAIAFERHDRLDRARELVRSVLADAPRYRPALCYAAHLEVVRGEPEAALEILASPALEQSWEALLLRAEIAFNLGRYALCEADLDRCVAAAIWIEPRLGRELDGRRSEAAYLARSHSRARALALASQTPFGKEFAAAIEGLADGDAPPRVELGTVPHIRQHHVTCAPASFAQVASHFGHEIDHLAIADEITYGGTPTHLLRRWAEARGWRVRQFDLTLDAARALLDRGIPFLLGTAASATAHMQSVIGYDQARSTLLVRDPSLPSLVEAALPVLMKTQAWHGPAAMVVVPGDRASSLDGLELPAAPLWDRFAAIQVALDAHDTSAAEAELAAMRAIDGAHRLAIEADVAIAHYRRDHARTTAGYERLLALFPDTPAWALRLGEQLRLRRPRSEQLAHWRRYAHLDDPPLLDAYAEELRMEGAEWSTSERLLHRALRIDPTNAMAHHVLADLEADRAAPPEPMLESYRFAACLAEHDEHFARAYYEAAREHGRDEEALAFLVQRVERAGARSAAPARTLFEVYADRGNPEKGVEVLERLCDARPKDGDLALELVHAQLERGDVAGADRTLARALTLASRAEDRALAQARLARVNGRLEEARAHLERAAVEAPGRVDVLLDLTGVIRELDGNAAAIARMEAAQAAAPDDPVLLRELCVALRGADEARAAALLSSHLALHPDDQWSRRELALVYEALGDGGQALRVAREAVSFLPHDSYAHGILGRLLARAGQRSEARASLRRAIELDLENVSAIAMLNEACEPEELREDARFVLDLMSQRVSRGPGLLEAAMLARCLPHGERIERIERALERAPRRPDGWEAVVRACLDAGDLDEAKRFAEEALARFPHWLTLRMLDAQILRLCGDDGGYEDALVELVARAPAWSTPILALARARKQRGDADGALRVLTDGLARAPRSIELRLEHAQIVHGRDPERAFDDLMEAVRDSFFHAPAFARLCEHAAALGRTDDVEALVRAQMGAAGALAHYRLAMLIRDPARLEERIDALREALRRDARHADAADLLAECLANAGRYDDALAACPPEGWAGPVPTTIHGRRAWVLAAAGRAKEAIEAMEQVLARDPSYSWGRRQLCDWLDRSGDAAGFLVHARALVEHEPHLPVNQVYLGDALFSNGDRGGARAAFARALELSPVERYAAQRCTELALEAGDDPTPMLAKLEPSLPPALWTSLSVRAHAARGREARAQQTFERLLALDPTHAELAPAFEALERERACAALEQALEDRDAREGSALASVWADAAAPRPWRSQRILRARERLGPAGIEALALFIEKLVAAKEWLAILWICVRHLSFLRRHDATWAVIGYALTARLWFGAARRWMRDWAGRKALRPWMLSNLVTAAWAGRQRELARAAGERALELPPDHTTLMHQIWLAFYRAISGRLDEASRLVAGRAAPKEEIDAAMLRLIEALRAAAAVPRAAPLEGRLAAAADHLRAVARTAARFADVRGPYEETIDTMFADRGWIVRWWMRRFHAPQYG